MSNKEPHVILGDWLLKMGYPKDKFPSDEELQKVCRGSIFRCFWKDVVKNVKPKQEVKFIKENLFVDSIRRYENIEGTSKAKLGQVLPPEPLLLWKKNKDKASALVKYKTHQEWSEHNLSDKLLKLKMKSYNIVQMRKTLCDKRREIHLLNETIKQMNEDVKQNKYLVDVLCNVPCLKEKVKESIDNNTEIDVLADFLNAASIKSPENAVKIVNQVSEDPFESLFSIKDDDSNVNVESVVGDVNISQLYNKLMERREEIIESVMSDNRIEEELKAVEDEARSRGVLPWKESLTNLSLMHCNVAVATLQNKKDLKSLVDEFKRLLVDKISQPKLPEHTLEVIKLKCKYAELNSQLNVYKGLHNELFDGSELFPKNICSKTSNTCLGESIVNVRDDIVSLYSMYGTKQSQIQDNVNKLTESIAFMKELRKTFVDYIGHGDFGSFDRNESMNFSFINANSTFKTSMTKCSKNLMDVKHLFSETNAVQVIKQDIYDVSKLQLKEIRMLKDFDLSRNRKIVLNNGAKLWIDETLHSLQYFDLNDQYALFKFVNPLQLTTGIAKDYDNKLAWKKSLENLLILIDKKKPEVFPMANNPQIILDEDSDLRIDAVLKNAKKCAKPLATMYDCVKSINKKVAFFTKTDFKKYISDERRFEGKTYYELEDDIRRMLAEEAYWKQ